MRWLTACIAAYMLGEPVVTFFTAVAYESGGIFLRLHAVAYGLPLIAAFVAGRSRRRRGRFPGSATLDMLARGMLVYWVLASAVGLVAGHSLKYWLSTSVNFQMPVLAYLATRSVDDPQLLITLVRRVIAISGVTVFLSLGSMLYAALVAGLIGVGGPIHLVPVAAGSALLSSGSLWLGGGLLGMGVITVLASLKRAVWGALVLYPLIYVVLRGAGPRRFLNLVFGAVVFVGLAFALSDRLPEGLDIRTVASRVESLYVETQGFTSGQAREDEIRSIWRSVATQGNAFTLMFGRGMGATYSYQMLTTAGEEEDKHHDTHVTPFGWLLRGGLVGVLLNSAFYALALVAAVRCAWRYRRRPKAAWVPAFAAYFLLALVMSLTAFSLTPNPVTHILLGLLLMSCATHRPQRSHASSRHLSAPVPNDTDA